MEIAVWWAALVVVWIATLNTLSVAEVVVAAVLAVPCAVAARTARRAAGLRWRFSTRWFRWLLALPGAIVHDTVALLLLAGRRRERDDEFRPIPLPEAPDRAAQEAAATAIVSATPGSVVVDAADDLLVHSVPIGRTRLERELHR